MLARLDRDKVSPTNILVSNVADRKKKILAKKIVGRSKTRFFTEPSLRMQCEKPSRHLRGKGPQRPGKPLRDTKPAYRKGK